MTKNIDFAYLLYFWSTAIYEALHTENFHIWFMVTLEESEFLFQNVLTQRLGKNFQLLTKNHSQDLTLMKRTEIMFIFYFLKK